MDAWEQIGNNDSSVLYAFNKAFFRKEDVQDIKETRFPNVGWYVKQVDGHIDMTDENGETLQYLEPLYMGYYDQYDHEF